MRAITWLVLFSGIGACGSCGRIVSFSGPFKSITDRRREGHSKNFRIHEKDDHSCLTDLTSPPCKPVYPVLPVPCMDCMPLNDWSVTKAEPWPRLGLLERLLWGSLMPRHLSSGPSQHSTGFLQIRCTHSRQADLMRRLSIVCQDYLHTWFALQRQ